MPADLALAPPRLIRRPPLAAVGPQARPAVQPAVLFALLLLMPIFLQFFAYLPDIRALWVLAKASPVLMIPFYVIGLLTLRLPHVWIYLLVLLYTVLVSPVLSMLHLQNNFVEAMAVTLKAFAFAFYFGVAAVFTLLRVNEATLSRTMLLLALANFGALWGLWIILPIEAYAWDGVGTGMLFNDLDRGPRIMMPLAFGLTGLFWVARGFSDRPALWRVLVIALGITLMLTIFKQRTAIAATAVVLLFGMTAGWRTRSPLTFWGAATGGVGLVALLVLAVAAGGSGGDVGGLLRENLGGSLQTREISAARLMEFMGQDPARWLFGVGATADFADLTLQHIMRFSIFFLSDLGWLGVLGEYGIFGSLLILLVYGVAFWETNKAARSRPTPFRYALRDIVTYWLLVSPVYSTAVAPGQIATITAMAVILQRLDRGQARAAMDSA